MRIANLTPADDGRLWTVIAYGALTEMASSTGEAKIRLLLQASASNTFRIFNLAVGTLPRVPVGSICRQEELVGLAQPDPIDVEIDSDQPIVGTAWTPLTTVMPNAPPGRYLIPPTVIEWKAVPSSPVFSHASLVVFRTRPGSRFAFVIIPAAEIARTWLLRSSALVHYYLRNAFDVKQLCTVTERNGAKVIRVAPAYAGDATYLAQLALSPALQASAANLTNGLTINPRRGALQFLGAVPPRQGWAQLQVHGRALKIGAPKAEVLLVSHISKAPAIPIQTDGLRIEIESVRHLNDDGETSEEGAPKGRVPLPQEVDDPIEAIRNTNRAARNIRAAVLPAALAEFQGSPRITRTYQDEASRSDISTLLDDSEPPSNYGTTAPDKTTKGGDRGINFQGPASDSEAARKSRQAATLKLIRATEEAFEAALTHATTAFGARVAPNFLLSRSAGDGCAFSRSGRDVRMAALTYRKRWIYAFEIMRLKESDRFFTNVIWKPYGEKFEEHDVQLISEKLAEHDFAWPKANEALTTFLTRTIQHRHTDVHVFGDKIRAVAYRAYSEQSVRDEADGVRNVKRQ